MCSSSLCARLRFPPAPAGSCWVYLAFQSILFPFPSLLELLHGQHQTLLPRWREAKRNAVGGMWRDKSQSHKERRCCPLQCHGMLSALPSPSLLPLCHAGMRIVPSMPRFSIPLARTGSSHAAFEIKNTPRNLQTPELSGRFHFSKESAN